MGRTPILDALLEYIKEENSPFSMPGNKSGRGFMNSDRRKDIREVLLRGDITEVDGLDNLHHPEGIIKEAQEMLSRFYGSNKSYFLVNGSTSGNLAMIFSAFDEGDKVLVERNCHRSIFNGIIMRKLKPVYIKNYINKNYNAPISIDMEHFLQVLEDNADIKGIILTYPNYYGITPDLKFIAGVCREKEIKVLVDCAHGAHFGISQELPENPMKLGADMAVMSAHKTLPSLTQTAYLHIGKDVNEEMVDFYVSAFTSTSPSYILMAMMDYARHYLESRGREVFENCIKAAEQLRRKISLLKVFHAITEEDIRKENPQWNIRADRTRLVINVEKGYNAHSILHYLRSSGVQCEMSDGFNLILILSPFNNDEDYEKLIHALESCPTDSFKNDYFPVYAGSLPEQAYLPWQAAKMKHIKASIEGSAGLISAVNIVPYPPGIPIVMMGEVIDKEAADMIQYYISNGVTVLGIEGHKIYTIG
ncbi:MAG: aminotransferase class I/II-fold pyridoxal phosphate-dependent enzyme [Bacillota bacterium]|nr:aminotransferase class I/II-fold pyridoxal phosphate-dependent enzyme [Bacillota bacterium]